MRTILILCGNLEAVDGIRAAKRMGLRVVLMDKNPECPGRALSDEYIRASIYDPDEVVAALERSEERSRIDGVLTIAADNPCSVAKAAKLLNLEALSCETASISSHKIVQKERLGASGVPTPWYVGVKSVEDVRAVLNGETYVLKPVDSRGSRGVTRVSQASQAERAFSHASPFSPSGQLILERWLPGRQLSAEAIVWNGEAYLCGIADRNYDRLTELDPYVIEDGGETPSRCSPELDSEIRQLLTCSARALGLTKGTIKADLVLTGKSLSVIEVAARLSGGYFSTVTIPKVYGYPIVEEAIRIALGGVPNLPSQPLTNVAWQSNRFLFCNPGVVEEISSRPEPDSELIVSELYLREGDRVPVMTNHTDRAGMVMAISDSPGRALSRCKEALDQFQIHIAPAA
jgi:biotin carboxylase